MSGGRGRGRAALVVVAGAAVLGGLAGAGLGCASNEKVARVIDGRPVSGEFVPAEAYAAYLRGAIADAAGDLHGAIEGYAIASALGPRDPEPLARLGDARCRRDAHDPRADEALGRALAIDGAYGPALEAKARCAERRGDTSEAIEEARRATIAEPEAVEPLSTLARLESAATGAATEELRARLVGVTLVAGTDVAAWDALATWAHGHGDVVLEGRALAEIASLAPSRRPDVEAAVRRFEGEGELPVARSLARASVEAAGVGAIDARIARLAIDEALDAGDLAAARRIATRSHVETVIVAARALLHGDRADAIAIASTLSDAEPTAIAPRLVLAAAADSLGDRAGVVKAVALRTRADGSVPPEAWLAFARTVAQAGAADGARAFLRGVPRAPLVEGDAVATPIAVALAAAGALDAGELDANGRVELAERSAEAAPDAAIAGADARHRFLALARRAPRDPGTIALARRLSSLRTRDAIVAVGFARLALAGAIDAPSMGEVLARMDPANPLVAGAALDCAVKKGDARAIPLARARLAGVADTAAERARAVE